MNASPPSGSVGSDLSALLEPRSIAVVGASSNPGRVGGMPVRFLDAVGFEGPLYPVNPGRSEVQGHPAYPDVDSLPEPVDLAVIAVPAPEVPATLRACARAGTRGAIVFSAGFAEVGTEGAELQRQITAIAAESGMRVCGPNCAGIMNPRTRLAATFGSHLAGDPHLVPGQIAIVSQSGAVGAYTFSLARAHGVGLSAWVTTGNEADTNLADYVEALSADPDTSVIAVYAEQFRDPDRFLAACESAHQSGTAVVALLAGKTEASSEALRSHTAALAGDRTIATAALRDLGVIEANSIGDLLSISTGLAARTQPRGPGVGIVTISGGAGIMMVDRCVERGLQVPPIPSETRERMHQLLPFAGTSNPLDVTGNVSNTPDVFGAFLDELLAADGIDGVLCFLGHVVLSPHVGQQLVDDFAQRCERWDGFACLIGMDDPENGVANRLAAARIPLYVDPVQAVDAFASALQARRGLEVDAPTVLDRRRETVTHSSSEDVGDRVLSEVEAQEALVRAGVRFPRQRLVRSAEEAVAAAAEVGEQLVLKIVSADLPHKSDVGGVLVGVAPAGVAAGYDELLSRVAAADPGARLEGVLIQEKVSGYPAIVGCKRDPYFGPAVLVGTGGIDAELIDDTALALAPLDEAAADELLARTKLDAVLAGSRGRAKLARSELVELLVVVSQMAWELRAEVASIELNPVLVGSEGAIAVDALIERKGADCGS